MHIEPGLVTGTKLVLGYATGMAVGGVALKLAVETVREKGIASFLVRTGVATALVFTFLRSCRIIRSGCPKCTSSSARHCSCCSVQRQLRSDWRSAFWCKACASCRPTYRNMA